ncbi:MAG: deoxyguanosinetriphosphate triphosphohydrolase [Chloroflexota bacterium]|nr:deoxyguanosinetriphosphate triphosphohydrolase [Chloroflexota bacterium]
MFYDRAQLEQLELQTLAPYALASARSAGRIHAEPEPAYRTAYQRDRDRIIHSAAFRRLEYKTQVFIFDEGDYYRTRLTHTLEVAQIGRTMARALRANEDLTEAICLAHDLGHPPFGHAGEAALDALMKDAGGFNHNHQSYRVVAELEERYPGWQGLNLTRETLAGLAKHETDYALSAVAGIDPVTRGSLEAQIANITDELAYTAHDVDDGLLAGLLTPDDLQALDIWQLVCANVGWKGGALDEIIRHALIRELVGVLVSDVLHTAQANLQTLAPLRSEDIQNHVSNVISYSVTMETMRLALRRLLYERMYYHHRVVRMAKRAERFIGEMFTVLRDDPRQLPPEWRRFIEARGLARTVADYIACMTDRSALLEYRRLFDPSMRP